MVNVHEELVSTLKTILPTHYELVLHSGLQTPCISYMEINNYDAEVGDTIGYSRLQYQVKVWGNNIRILNKYAQDVCDKLKPLGFKRISSGELYDTESTMIQKIMTFEALALEEY